MFRDFDEGAEVLGKAAPAEAQRRIQEAASDALIHTHAVGHFLHIRARRLAQHRDGVDVGNLEREKRIRRVLDQLRRIDVRHDDGGVERGINLLHRGHRPLRADANDHAVGSHQILDGKSLPQKLRVADHVEINVGFAITLDGLRHIVAGLDRHGALINHYFIAGHGAGNLARDLFDEAQIHRPVRQGRRWHGDEDHIRPLHALRRARGETQPARGGVLFYQLLQTWFVNGDAALLQDLHLGGIVIHADHPVAHLGKASTGDEANVACPDNRQLHFVSIL